MWGVQITLVSFNLSHPNRESGVVCGESAEQLGLHIAHSFNELLFERFQISFGCRGVVIRGHRRASILRQLRQS